MSHQLLREVGASAQSTERDASDPHAVRAAIDSVIEAGRFSALRGWTPATAGNFSARAGDGRIAITRSGRDKGALVSDDVALVDLIADPDQPAVSGLSAEAPLHFARYLADPSIGVIVHVHSVEAAVLSREHARAGHDAIRLEGWELLKAFSGITTHEVEVTVPVFANAQDTGRLAVEVEQHLASLHASADATHPIAPGYLLAGHGLYAWGATLRDALRHLEAFDALFRLVRASEI